MKEISFDLEKPIYMRCIIKRLCLIKPAGRFNIFITGSTGILGSQLLFELLPLYVNKLVEGKIVLMVRADRKSSPGERITKMLTHSSIPDELKSVPLSDLLKHIIVINSGLADFSSSKLPSAIRDYIVIHAASSVNLGTNETAGNEIEENNYRGTLHLISEMTGYMRQFIFVSTAYSSGHRSGKILNDFLGKDDYIFRNPYEKFKHQTEKYIEYFCPTQGIEWKIIRPSIICGRLIDSPRYAISRFLVFYLFARYAMVMKRKLTGEGLRLVVPRSSDINIVPVDYVAKALIASIQTPIQQLNVVHPNNVSCRSLFQHGFGLIHFSNFSFVEEIPSDINPVERMLYNTVGQQLGPYMNTPEHHFDTSLLDKLISDVMLPEIEDHFCGLLEFAVNHNFVPLY